MTVSVQHPDKPSRDIASSGRRDTAEVDVIFQLIIPIRILGRKPDQLFRRSHRSDRRALIDPAFTEISCHPLHHTIEHPLCLKALVRITVYRVCLKGSLKLCDHCIFVKVRDLIQFLFYFSAAVHFILSPCDLLITGGFSQDIQVVFTDSGHISHIAPLIPRNAQHLLSQSLERMGVRRSAVVVRLVPVHSVERLEAIASVRRRSHLLRVGSGISDRNPIIPQLFHTIQVHGANFLSGKLPVRRTHRRRPARGVLRLDCHCRLYLRRQIKESLCRQIVQRISCVKHFPVKAVYLLRRVNALITEVICHLGTDVIDLRNIEHHTSVPHLLGDIAVRMGFSAGAFPTPRTAIEIPSVLIMCGLVTEGKKDIITCSQSRRVHPDHNTSIRHRRTAIQGIQHIVGFINPFHDRVSRCSLLLCARSRSFTLRKSQPGIILDIHKAVELIR